MNAEFELTITPTEKDFAYWRSRSYVTDDVRQSIEDANLLILPYEGFREALKPVFAKEAGNIYKFLKERASSEFRPELCMSDEEYQEIELNHWVIDLGLIIADKVVLAMAVSALYDYLKKRFQRSKNGAVVKVEVIEQSADGVIRCIRYEGPPQHLQRAFDELSDEARNGNSSLGEEQANGADGIDGD